jgi:murein L,D-transpeptidase YcbB/YkuD
MLENPWKKHDNIPLGDGSMLPPTREIGVAERPALGLTSRKVSRGKGMRLRHLVAVLLCTAQVYVLAAVLPACAEDSAAPTETVVTKPAAPSPAPAPVAEKAAADPAVPAQPAAPAGQPPLVAEPLVTETAVPPPPVDPVVAIIRSKLADPGLRKGAHADDLAALQAFYGARTGGPLWITEMGFSARGQSALFEIEKADDWGLAASVFELPLASNLPASPEAQGLAEIKLDLAILKYARFARGGRVNPSELSRLLDQEPPLRDAKIVLAEIEAADAPEAYLQSLHPKHEQFVRLRQALLKAREPGEESAKPARSERDIKRLVINMERWRWMPEDLGALYVWSNTPEFKLYVVKDGKTIFADKTLVGTIGYATPIFSADMATIVFNPDWVAPPTVLVEKLLPSLRRKHYSILKSNKLSVSHNGKPVDARKIDWNRVDIRSFTFTQKSGSKNVLGKIKFLYPNKHIVYMHDTLPYRRKVFKESKRDIGYGCVRMAKPQQFAQALLAADKEWPASQVKTLWDKGLNKSVTLDHKLPVHTTYFTSVVDDKGKVASFGDLYGIDRKLATALFGTAKGFPVPPPQKKRPQRSYASAPAHRTSGGSGIAGSMQGFLDE